MPLIDALHSRNESILPWGGRSTRSPSAEGIRVNDLPLYYRCIAQSSIYKNRLPCCRTYLLIGPATVRVGVMEFTSHLSRNTLPYVEMYGVPASTFAKSQRMCIKIYSPSVISLVEYLFPLEPIHVATFKFAYE